MYFDLIWDIQGNRALTSYFGSRLYFAISHTNNDIFTIKTFDNTSNTGIFSSSKPEQPDYEVYWDSESDWCLKQICPIKGQEEWHNAV